MVKAIIIYEKSNVCNIILHRCIGQDIVRSEKERISRWRLCTSLLIREHEINSNTL